MEICIYKNSMMFYSNVIRERARLHRTRPGQGATSWADLGKLEPSRWVELSAKFTSIPEIAFHLKQLNLPSIVLLQVAGHLGDSVSIQHFPEDVQTNLISMAEWLTLNNKGMEFMNVYGTVRGSVLKRSLDQLRDHHKSCSTKSLNRWLSCFFCACLNFFRGRV